jgi:5-methylthioadenosine/S-adenosylhomocysteine deaminase
MSRLIIQGGMILTLDDAGTYYEVGTVIVEDDRIVSILPGSPLYESRDND